MTNAVTIATIPTMATTTTTCTPRPTRKKQTNKCLLNALLTSPPLMIRLIVVITTAVPQAPTSLNEATSVNGTGLCSTVKPSSSASCMRDLLVIDGSTAGLSGVTNLLSSVTAKKFEVENSWRR